MVDHKHLKDSSDMPQLHTLYGTLKDVYIAKV